MYARKRLLLLCVLCGYMCTRTIPHYLPSQKRKLPANMICIWQPGSSLPATIEQQRYSKIQYKSSIIILSWTHLLMSRASPLSLNLRLLRYQPGQATCRTGSIVYVYNVHGRKNIENMHLRWPAAEAARASSCLCILQLSCLCKNVHSWIRSQRSNSRLVHVLLLVNISYECRSYWWP